MQQASFVVQVLKKVIPSDPRYPPEPQPGDDVPPHPSSVFPAQLQVSLLDYKIKGEKAIEPDMN